MARNYLQGKYTLINPEKYVGDKNNICFRSSWERTLCVRFDKDPAVIKWSSEEVVVPYFDKASGKIRRYFVDFWVQTLGINGKIKKTLIEVKPHAQTLPPKQPTRKTKRYVEAVSTYITNQSKWEAAKEYCRKSGMEFAVLTENEIYGKK